LFFPLDFLLHIHTPADGSKEFWAKLLQEKVDLDDEDRQEAAVVLAENKYKKKHWGKLKADALERHGLPGATVLEIFEARGLDKGSESSQHAPQLTFVSCSLSPPLPSSLWRRTADPWFCLSCHELL
jgi:hypothetical protein